MSSETETSSAPPAPGKKRGLSFTKQVLLGLLLGIAVGVFFGEYVGWMKVAGDAFIGLLQMTVLPYIMVALIANVGRLTWGQGRQMILRGLSVLLVLWGVGIAAVVLMPLALPEWETASFFSTSLVQPPPEVDFLDLFIPFNIFGSLARNVVPAIVVFCICIGAALMGMKNKGTMLAVLDAFADSLMRVNTFVVKLTPYGVFAITASVAGTMTTAELGRLQAYLVVLTVVTLFLTFWVMPMLVAALTPFSYREVMRASKDALVTAFATGKTLIVLPMLIENTKAMFRKIDADQDEVSHAVDVIYPLAYPFPSIGKVLVLFFIPFTAWFVGSEMALWDFPALISLGLFSLFGGPVVAVPFLLDFQRLPADMFQLFIASGVYSARLGDLASAMHLVAIAVLTTAGGAGVLHVHWRKLLRLFLTTMGIGVLLLIGTNAYLALALDDSAAQGPIVNRMELLAKDYEFFREYEILETASPNPQPLQPGQSRLERIRERGVIRVGFRPRALPWSYFNDRGELVGLDVDMAHRLGFDLDVKLEFVPFDSDTLAEQIAADHFDLAMSGIPGLLSVAERFRISASYLEVHVGLLVRDHRRHEFRTRAAIRKQERIRLGVSTEDAFVRRIELLNPNVEIVPLARVEDFLEGRVELDAVLTTAEGGSAWTLRYPGFSIVTPSGRPVSLPLVYAMPNGDSRFSRFIDHWVDLKRQEATVGFLYDHWILGVTAEPKRPRWSVLRDVLHWVD